MKTIFALYTASAREFMRDRLASFFTLLLPICFAIFFGMMFGGSSSQHIDLGLVNQDIGPAGQQIVASLTSADAQSMLNVRTGSRDEMLAALNKGDIGAVIVLPPGLTQAFAGHQPVNVDVFYDQGRQMSSGLALGTVRNLLADIDMRVQGTQALLTMNAQAVQTTPLKAVDFYIPSLLAMAMLWLGLFATTLPIVQQREQGILRRLSASPVPRIFLLASQTLWRLTVGILQAAIFLVVGIYLLGLHVQGNWLLLGAAIILGALVFISFGYLLAGISRTSEAAVALAQVANFPMMFLSGLFFEPQMLPDYLRPVMNIMPPAYLGDAFRQIMVGYNPLHPLWLDFAVLAGFLVVFVALGLRFFKWESV
jgi:ABC-2 type transport system permease protein